VTKVRLTTQISGSRDGQDWPAAGTVVDLPPAEARALVQGGSAAEVDADDQATVLVPPDGVHIPGTTGYLAEGNMQGLVEAPADAVSNPDGVLKALKDRKEGNVVEVPVGVGVQNPDGSALPQEQVEKNAKAEKETQEFLSAVAPKVGESSTKTAKSADKTPAK
jgi:hypothetical protein